MLKHPILTSQVLIEQEELSFTVKETNNLRTLGVGAFVHEKKFESDMKDRIIAKLLYEKEEMDIENNYLRKRNDEMKRELKLLQVS